MSRPERFWLEDPRDLICRFNILPSHKDSFEAKLNAITRLLIIVTIILAIVKWRHWQLFLSTWVILLIAVYLNHTPSLIEHFDEDLKDFSYYKDPVVSTPIVETKEAKVETSTDVSKETPMEIIVPLAEAEVKEIPMQDSFTYWKAPAVDYIPKRNFVVANGRRK